VHEARSIPERREPLAGDRQGVGVTVEPDDGELREPREEGARVPAHAERRVDEHRAFGLDGRREQLERALEHDWGMDTFDVHDSFGTWSRIPIPIRSS
jgi:hypothetical protein